MPGVRSPARGGRGKAAGEGGLGWEGGHSLWLCLSAAVVAHSAPATVSRCQSWVPEVGGDGTLLVSVSLQILGGLSWSNLHSLFCLTRVYR